MEVLLSLVPKIFTVYFEPFTEVRSELADIKKNVSSVSGSALYGTDIF